MRVVSQIYAIMRFRKLDLYWYLPHSLFPLLLLFIFWRLGGRELGQNVFVGWLVALAASGGVGTLPQFILFYKFIRLQEMFVAAPLHPFTYMIGVGLYALLYALPGWTFILTVMIGLGLLSPAQIPAVLASLVLTWALSCAIGFMIATTVKRMAIISPVATMAWLILGLMPPVYYPVEMIPESFRWVAWLFPTAHVAQLLRGILGIVNLSAWDKAIHGVVALAITCGLVVWAATRSRWREV